MMVFMVNKQQLFEPMADTTIGISATVFHQGPLVDLKSERFFI